MTSKEGWLQAMPTGRWAVTDGRSAPVEISSGEVFRVDVAGELKPTRMEFRRFCGPMKGREFRGQSGEYYSVDDYELRPGLRAAIGNGR